MAFGQATNFDSPALGYTTCMPDNQYSNSVIISETIVSAPRIVSGGSSVSLEELLLKLRDIESKLRAIQPDVRPSLKELEEEIKKLKQATTTSTAVQNTTVIQQIDEPFRRWTNCKGARSVEGKLVGVSKSVVQILRSDGKVFKASIISLSAEDVAYVARRLASKSLRHRRNVEQT